MIGDVIDTSGISTPAFSWEFAQKSQIETSTHHSASYPNILSVKHAFLGFAILQPTVQNSNNAKMNNIPSTVFHFQDIGKIVMKNIFSGNSCSSFQTIHLQN